MKYMINSKQLTCINIIIKTLQEAINRECFSEEEITKIIKIDNQNISGPFVVNKFLYLIKNKSIIRLN